MTQKTGVLNAGLHKLLPHIGKRKLKSVLAVLLGYWIWQTLRFFFPGLELHPVFVYIYALIEIRDTSEKTSEFVRTRMKTTLVGLGTGLPLLALSEFWQDQLPRIWMQQGVELLILLSGILLTLIVAEKVGCKTFCGLAAAIFVIMIISHGDGDQYIYSVLRAFQTMIGCFVAWLINVKWFPYHGPKQEPQKTDKSP